MLSFGNQDEESSKTSSTASFRRRYNFSKRLEAERVSVCSPLDAALNNMNLMRKRRGGTILLHEVGHAR